MKKIQLTLLLAGVSLCMWSCKKEARFDNNILVGNWIVEKTDKIMPETDKIFFTSYASNGEHSYGYRVATANGASEWVSVKDANYTFNGNEIQINYPDNHIRLEVREMNGSTLIYQTKQHIKSGKEIKDPVVYTMRRTEANYSTDILGTWQGIHMNNLSRIDSPIRYTFLKDGSYKFYKTTDNGLTWDEQIDSNPCNYYLNSNLIATTFKPAANLVCNNWIISIEGNKMVMTAKRDGKEERYELTKL